MRKMPPQPEPTPEHNARAKECLHCALQLAFINYVRARHDDGAEVELEEVLAGLVQVVGEHIINSAPSGMRFYMPDVAMFLAGLQAYINGEFDRGTPQADKPEGSQSLADILAAFQGTKQ